ncbi:MAG TPA: PAS domain-containing protein [Bacteroidales bacterium]|nr:PAS domain-containing protein [Bacteroidales bacterium]
MLTTLLVYISATLLCAVIYLIISKSRNSHTNVQNLQTGENLNIDLLGNLFWKVFNSSNHAILLLQNYKIVNCNQRALKLFDSDYDYLVGKTPFDLSPEYQPDGEKSDIKGKLILEEIFKKGVVNFEWSQKKSNAELFIADISATSFEVNGLYYVAATMRDITLQKKEQQELTEHRSHLEKLVSEKTALLEEKNFRLKKLNQELDATNEELISNNEELVCTNEQLEKEIQEHLKTQEQKAIAEEKIKQFILQSGNGIIIINSQGVIEEWNEAMTEISGIDKAQAVNNFIWNINAQWSPSIDKESEIERFRKNTMDFFDNIKKENGHFYSFETKIIHAALGEKYLQIFMYPIVANRESYAGCIINDITLKKTTETELDKYKTDLEILLAKNSERLMQLSSRFNEVYAVSSDAITFVDIEEDGVLKVFDMNPTAQKVFQINCDDIKKGLPVENLLPPEKIKPFIEKIRPSLLKGETITISEDTNIGNGYWKTTIYPITGADGTITRVAAISKDITALIARSFWPTESQDQFCICPVRFL